MTDPAASAAGFRAPGSAPLPGPLPHRPEVLERIRPMQMRDVPRVAALHHAAMGNSLWSRLGPRFLRTVYRLLVDSPHFLAFVYEEDHELAGPVVEGFIAGSTDTSRMYREVFRQGWPALGVAALPGLLRRPGVLRHLARTGSYFEDSGGDIPAESLFCSFVPRLRGTGVSNQVNKVLFDDLLARGHRRVKITTEADNRGANRQLTSWGFEAQARFRYYGKEMVRYVLDLERSPRVESVSRHPAV